jgi:hypothetical protein
MKIPVDFEQTFDTERCLPIPLARLHIGNHVGRLVFTPAGKTVLHIPWEAMTDGSIVLLADLGIGPAAEPSDAQS